MNGLRNPCPISLVRGRFEATPGPPRMPPPMAGAGKNVGEANVGDRVQIYWDGEGKWFCAFVEEVASGGRVRVKYQDDDEVHWEDVNDLVAAPVSSIHAHPHGATQVLHRMHLHVRVIPACGRTRVCVCGVLTFVRVIAVMSHAERAVQHEHEGISHACTECDLAALQ